MSLAAGAAVLWLTSGVAIGVLSALRRGSVFDRAAMGVALAGVSLPIFFTGLLSLSIFSYGLGITAPGGSYTRIEDNPLLWAYDLLLPWITLAFLYSAAYARLTRAGMLDTMGEDFIRTARAKGLPERTVVVKHGLRAALTPILTLFGLDLGLLLGGAILTESTFSLPGIGKYSIDAVTNNDLPKVLGVVIVGSLFIILANLVVDLLYAVVDPRVRTSMTRVPDGRPAVPRRPRPARALPHRRRRGQGRRRAVVLPRARRPAGDRGGVGLGQEREQPGDHGAAPAARRSPARSGSAASSSSARTRSGCAGCAAAGWR